MADDSLTNHPSLPSDYVSIIDLRDQWLRKQQQKQPQHQQEEQVRIKTTMKDKGKEKVQDVTTNHPSLPTNYVTILDLRERWLKQKQQQQQQQQQEENDRIKTTVSDKGKEKIQEVTVDCQFDGISDENNPHFRKPNPNLIPERGFCRNTQEKAQVTVDCQVDGNSDKNSLQFGNPNPNLIPEREFCRNTKEKAQVTIDCQVYGNADKNSLQFRNPKPNLIREREFRRNFNGSNRRPTHRGFHGREKISTPNQTGKASSSSLEGSEASDGVKIESDSVVDGGQLKDTPLMSKYEKKKLRRGILCRKMKESKEIAKKEREDEEMSKSKIRAVGGKRKEIEMKMKEIIGAIGEKTKESEMKMKETNVSKIGGIAEKTRESEAKTKDINVSQIWRIVEKTREKEEVVVAEKSGLMWKNVGEVGWGDWRAKTGPKMEVYGRGRGRGRGRGWRVSNKPRWANSGEGYRGDKGGLMWVKKGEGAHNVVFNNGCESVIIDQLN